MIDIREVTVRYGGVVALDNVTMRLADDVVGLIGPNGAGKTTLVNAFSGFAPVAFGSIRANGLDLLTLQPHERARWGLARSFQRPQIVPDLTVEQHLAAVLDGKRLPRAERAVEIARALDFVGLTAARNRKGISLNPYQGRMTEIARCLVSTPRIVLLDEPGGGLSEAEMVHLRRIIADIHPQFGAQVLLIDHDVELIRDVCISSAVLDFGRLIAFGPTIDVLRDEVVKTAYLGR